jgi:cysteine-rich repeat protein
MKATSCLDCAPGYFQSETGKSFCSDCAAGTFTDTAASTTCQNCPIGKYQSETGKSSCVDCEVGKFQETTGAALCENCPTGTFQAVAGSTTCDGCVAGTFQDALGSTTCENCQVGTFQDMTSASACTACSVGTFQDTEGAIACQSCASGTYQNMTGGGFCVSGDHIWKEVTVSSAPDARLDFGFSYDSVNNLIFVYGGDNGMGGSLGDTWRFNGTEWTKLDPSTAPPARIGHVMAFDAARKKTVMFGGNTGPGVNSQTWAFDGTNWNQESPAASPTARAFAAMAYHAPNSALILFGGLDGAAMATGDTWAWDGSTWNNTMPSTSPSARYWTAMAYDSTRQKVVLFGGYNGTTSLQDTWEWDGSNWTEVTPASPNPSPPARSNHRMAFDSELGRVILFGGADDTGFLNDTWSWNGTAWVEQNKDNDNQLLSVAPGARSDHMLVYDAPQAKSFVFGGGGDLVIYSDTWGFGAEVTPTPTPTPPPSSDVCGDGKKGETEECDDGNTESGDGCSSTCQEEDCFFCKYDQSQMVSQCGICNNRGQCVESVCRCDSGYLGDRCAIPATKKAVKQTIKKTARELKTKFGLEALSIKTEEIVDLLTELIENESAARCQKRKMQKAIGVLNRVLDAAENAEGVTKRMKKLIRKAKARLKAARLCGNSATTG